VPAGVATGGLVRGANTVWQGIKQLAPVAAAEGALAGAGYSEADTPIGVAEDSAIGAGIGLGMGAGVPLAGRAIAAVPGAFSYLTRTGPSDAARVVSDAMRDAVPEVTPGNVVQRYADMGPEATLTDVAGEAGITQAQALLGADPQRVRPIAAEVFRRRGEGVHRRVDEALTEATGVRLSYNQAEDVLDETRRANADALYQQAYNREFNPADPELMQFINRPGIRRHLGRVLDNARNEGRELPAIERIVLAGDDVTIGEELMPDFQSWDSIYRSLRNRTKDLYRSGNSDEAASLGKLTEMVRARLDRLNPDYPKARAVYQEDISNLNALQEGSRILSIHRRDFDRWFDSATPEQRTNYLIAAVEEIRDRMAHKPEGAKSVWNFLDVPAFDYKLRKLTGSDAKANKLKLALKAERQFLESKNKVVDNSQTALRQQASKQFGKRFDATSSPLIQLINKAIPEKVNAEQRQLLTELMFTPGNGRQVKAILEQARAPRELINRIMVAYNRTAGPGMLPGATGQGVQAIEQEK